MTVDIDVELTDETLLVLTTMMAETGLSLNEIIEKVLRGDPALNELFRKLDKEFGYIA